MIKISNDLKMETEKTLSRIVECVDMIGAPDKYLLTLGGLNNILEIRDKAETLSRKFQAL